MNGRGIFNALTVGELRELLAGVDPAAFLCDQSGDLIKHASITADGFTVIISTTLPIGKCKRSGTQVFAEEKVSDYPAYSPELDENLFSFEYEPEAADAAGGAQ